MIRTQVYLTKDQERGLKRLAASSGRKQSELIREAIEGYLAERQPKDWKEALEAVRGMWAAATTSTNSMQICGWIGIGA